MSELDRAAAKLFAVGFSGTTPSPELRELQARGISGTILFRRNIESPQQVQALCAELKKDAARPFLTSLDQEGGRVMRLREPFTAIPPMRTLGEARHAGLAEEVGRILARELRAVNIDLDFAPVLDVDTNPQNPVIGDRSFSQDVAEVARLGCALLRGLQSEGVAACGKHFPGHGDTAQDSHLELPRLTHALERLEEIELRPFAAAITSGIASIMTAHVIFEAFDPHHPATMSRPSLDGILRDRMRFDGVVISDDLEMKAITDHFGIEEAVVRGVNAGVDLFLVCHTPALQHQAIDALRAAVERGEVSRARLEQAGRRIDTLAARFVQPPHERPLGDLLGSAAHQKVCEEILERCATKSPNGEDPTEALA